MSFVKGTIGSSSAEAQLEEELMKFPELIHTVMWRINKIDNILKEIAHSNLSVKTQKTFFSLIKRDMFVEWKRFCREREGMPSTAPRKISKRVETFTLNVMVIRYRKRFSEIGRYYDAKN